MFWQCNQGDSMPVLEGAQNQSGHGAQTFDATASRVLTTEADALRHMAGDLPADFAAACNAILSSAGRVVICGIGKSGHIGRKIAATLASTGTPAYFVHAAETSHGDMGMITRADVCVLISNSGETSELADVIHYTRRFDIPLIGISSNPASTLMKAADFRLTLPKMPEACSIGKAPTTSTTLTLALGDALAVALMEQRNFDATQFQVFHPGGKLGAQLSRVSDLMHGADSVPMVPQNTPMSEVLLTMTAKGFGVSAVVDENGALMGVISDGDLRRNMADLLSKTAGDLMGGAPVTAAPDDLAATALATLNHHKIGALIVVDAQATPVGVVHVHDLLQAGVA